MNEPAKLIEYGIDWAVEGGDYTTVYEPQCQHCGKTLSEALRGGCNEEPCKGYEKDRGNDGRDDE